MKSITALSFLVACLFAATSAAPGDVVPSPPLASASVAINVNIDRTFFANLKKLNVVDTVAVLKKVAADNANTDAGKAIGNLATELEKYGTNSALIQKAIICLDTQLVALQTFILANESKLTPAVSKTITDTVNQIGATLTKYNDATLVINGIADVAVALFKMSATIKTAPADQQKQLEKQITDVTAYVKSFNDNADALTKYIQTACNTLTTLLAAATAGNLDINKALTPINTIVGGGPAPILNVSVTNPVAGLLQLVLGLLNALLSPVVGILLGDGGLVSGLLGGLSGSSCAAPVSVGGVLNGLTGTAGGLLNGVTGTAGGLLNGVTGTVGGLANGVLGTAGGLLGPLLSIVFGLLNGLTGGAGGNGLLGGLLGGGGGGGGGDLLGGLLGGNGLLGGLLGGNGLLGGLLGGTGLGSTLGGLTGTLGGLTGGLGGLTGGLGGLTGGLGGLTGGLGGITGGITGALGGITGGIL